MGPICAIVLAAGQARRMGAQKLLLPLGGQPVIVRIIEAVRRSPIDQIVVVVGRDGDRVKEVLANRGIRFVTNPVAESEMLDSVRCGLRGLPAECAGAMIVLGDQPGVTASLMSRLVRAFGDWPDGIIVPTHQGRRGHPLVLSMRYREEVLSRFDETGLRGLLRAYPGQVREVEVENRDLLEDMDQPADYDRMATRFGP